MQYWRGGKQTTKETPQPPSHFELATSFVKGSPGTERKLTALSRNYCWLYETVSSIFFTWVKLMSRELSALIVWPNRQQVKKTQPSCWESFIRRSDALLTALSASWKLQVDLIWQQLSGANINITILSKSLLQSLQMELFHMCHHAMEGGHLVFSLWETVYFLNMIEPYDEIMADRGFKIREDLMMHMATICISPSCASLMQLLPQDVTETSNIARVRIYVEQAIGRLKVFLPCQLPYSPWLMTSFLPAVLCVICSHHYVCNIFLTYIFYHHNKIQFRYWVWEMLSYPSY